jgi:phage shock protein PspC (stress-responsive transcriptional regulator)
MSLADELERLAALQERGVLSAEEFQQAKARLIAASQAPLGAAHAASTPDHVGSAVQRLRRSTEDRWMGGICGGIARLTGIESWVWRLAFTLLFLFWGAGLLIYVLLWIFVPEDGR